VFFYAVFHLATGLFERGLEFFIFSHVFYEDGHPSRILRRSCKSLYRDNHVNRVSRAVEQYVFSILHLVERGEGLWRVPGIGVAESEDESPYHCLQRISKKGTEGIIYETYEAVSVAHNQWVVECLKDCKGDLVFRLH